MNITDKLNRIVDINKEIEAMTYEELNDKDFFQSLNEERSCLAKEIEVEQEAELDKLKQDPIFNNFFA